MFGTLCSLKLLSGNILALLAREAVTREPTNFGPRGTLYPTRRHERCALHSPRGVCDCGYSNDLGVCVSCVERLWLVLSKLLWFWLSWGLSFTVQFSLPVPYIMPDERYAIKQQGGYLASYTASGPDLQPIWHLQPISARR